MKTSAAKWGIYRQDHRTGEMVRYRPTLDGKPRVFTTRKAAMDFAYDYDIAGQRNQWVEYRRETNPRSARRKIVVRGKAAGRGKGKTVTTVTNSKVIRRTNPRVALYATKPGMRQLKYLGHGKFGERGRAVLFGSVAEGNAAGRVLRDTFPQALRGWTVSAGAEAPPAAERRGRRRKLPQGVDPAELMYREQARRDSAVAHRWLDKHGK